MNEALKYSAWGTENQCQPCQGTGNQCQKKCGAENQCPKKYALKISTTGVTLKRSAHQISVIGTDFQRVYFPQCTPSMPGRPLLKVDVFVGSAGTGGTVMGVSHALQQFAN